MPYKDKEKQKAHMLQYAMTHKSKRYEYNRRYAQTHKEAIAERAKKYWKEHKDELIQKRKAREALHKVDRASISRAYYHRHKQEMVNYRYARAIALKIEVLTYYGNGKCACTMCGYDNLAALSIDHINGNGCEHRRTLGNYNAGGRFYSWLKRGGFPTGYQTLCMNCQWVKRIENMEIKKHNNPEASL